MYRIGVLSDTHLAATSEALAFLVDLADSYFAGVDMILHAGDVVAPEILQGFTHCPVMAVRGNMDPATPGIPDKRVIEVGPARIGLMHGWGASYDLEERLLNEFSDAELDVLVFGHSHRPVCRFHDGILLFNPGSATDRRQAPYHSVGILEIGEKISGKIIRID
ncbi:MAG: metallophosphoesterase [Desulfuromonadales bacterium]|nr:metallophosphoesterase [Desulfuromonadales bacterium]